MKENEYPGDQRKQKDKKLNKRRQIPFREIITRHRTQVEMKFCPKCGQDVMLADNVCIHCKAEYPVVLNFGTTPEGKA